MKDKFFSQNHDISAYRDLNHLPYGQYLVGQFGSEDIAKSTSFLPGFNHLRAIDLDGKTLKNISEVTDPKTQFFISSSPTISGMEQLSEKFQCHKLMVHDLRDEIHFAAIYLNNKKEKHDRYFTIRNEENDALSAIDDSIIQKLEKGIVEMINEEQPRVRLCTQGKDQATKTYPLCGPDIQLLSAVTEKDLIEKYGAIYERSPIVDHRPASYAILHRIADLMRKNPNYFHMIHCSAGQGRTLQVAMLFYALNNFNYCEATVMYENGKGKVSFCKNKEAADGEVHARLKHVLFPWAQSASVQKAWKNTCLPLPEIQALKDFNRMTAEEYVEGQKLFGRTLEERTLLSMNGGGDG